MATNSARRKFTLATINSIANRRVRALMNLAKVKAKKRQMMDLERKYGNLIRSLEKRLNYEIEANREVLNVIDVDDQDQE